MTANIDKLSRTHLMQIVFLIEMDLMDFFFSLNSNPNPFKSILRFIYEKKISIKKKFSLNLPAPIN